MTEILVSGCIITQGAPELLERCLDDMLDFVDEILVIDGGPGKETRKVTESKAKTVYIANPWPNNISQQRNVYMKAARGKWIFSMDTDERLEPGFGNDLEKWIEDDDLDGACFPRPWRVDEENFVFSQFHYPDFNFRLIRNRPGIAYRESSEYAVHHAFDGVTRPIRLLKSPMIYHDIFIHEGIEERGAKIQQYDEMSNNQSGSNYKQFYLYEDFPHHICQLNERPPLDAFPDIVESVSPVE